MLRRPVIAIALAMVAPGCEADEDGPCADLDDDACTAVLALRLPESLPPSPGNAHADDPAAAALGFEIFFAPGFAQGRDIRCATCHLPELAFHDAGPVSIGLGTGTRNAPTTLHAARLPVIFWDGRADSLWSQPLFAFENPAEMDFTRLELAHRVADDAELRAAYVTVFGAPGDVSALPARGKPGDPAFDDLTGAQQLEVNRIAASIGKALEAYMRLAVSGPAPLDAYLDGDDAALSPSAARGLRVFTSAGCIGCHGGPMLSDGGFHEVGLPSLPDAAPDPGRAEGARIAATSIFNAAGPFADVPGPRPALDDAAVGAFRTPSLRDIVATAPYGHDGALTTLDDVFDAHAPMLAADDREALLAFLLALDGEPPPRPWGDWPRPQ